MSRLPPPLPAETSVDAVCERLEVDGFAIVERYLDADRTRATRAALQDLLAQTPRGRNDFEGFATQRVYALFAKTRAFDALAIDPLVLGVLDRVLGPSYQLSAPQAIQIGPGETAQNLHRDDGVYPIPRPHPEVVVNTMWALDDFTAANGATMVVPGSHKWVDQRPDASTGCVQALMPAGSVMFFLGDVFHGGGANTTDAPRLGVIVEYCAGWLRQQENQYLAVPASIVRELPERLQELLGYAVHGNLIGNVDARHPRKWLARQGPG